MFISVLLNDLILKDRAIIGSIFFLLLNDLINVYMTKSNTIDI